MAFPETRLRRLRRTTAIRNLIREHHLLPVDMVLPLFVQHGTDQREEIEAVPGHARLSIDLAVREAERAHAAGIGGLILFGIPSAKDDAATEAYDDEGIVQMAVRAIKDRLPELLVVTDVCLCQYTTHGHCGVVHDNGSVDNDITLELLSNVAVSHARAGADIVAPSDMMDGRVGTIRASLDGEGFTNTGILAYSAKFASAFYGPFREAAGSTPQFGDRRAYQMDPANGEEALREAIADLEEGADMLMVKPAGPYLDVVQRIKEELQVPLAVYHVSGEYAMVKAAAANGWIDERQALLEALVGMKRAGADVIITYAALEAAAWLERKADA